MTVVSVTLEAIVVGIAAVIMGMLVHVVFGYHAEHAKSPRMKKEMVALAVTLFFTGFFIGLAAIGLGWKRTYCKKL